MGELEEINSKLKENIKKVFIELVQHAEACAGTASDSL